MSTESVTHSNGVRADGPFLPPLMLRYLELLAASKVPPQLHEGLARYLAHGVLPGSFLLAALSNDSASAIRRADDDCRAGYGELLLWLARHAPIDAWGSDENVAEWRRAFSERCHGCYAPAREINLEGLCEACARKE